MGNVLKIKNENGDWVIVPALRGESVEMMFDEESHLFKWKRESDTEWQTLYDISEIYDVVEIAQLEKEHIGFLLYQAETAKSEAESARDLASEMAQSAESAKSEAESARDIAINKALEAKGFSEEAYDYYAGISTMKREVEEKHEEVMSFDVEAIPAYWKAHLDEKMNTIKALQDEGGKDCFSFVVMTDLHYPSNLGKKSPALAKYIMDKCGIKYALCLGDVQSRGSYARKEDAKAEFEKVKEMFEPISDKLLQTQGNHDGSWGTAIGDVTYPYNFTPEELYNSVYRNSHLINGAKTDATGTAYYVDHEASNVRFIILNTHCNKYEENADESAKYNNMRSYRFTQSQYDFLVNYALNTDKKIIVCGHAPIHYTKDYALRWGGEESDSINTSGDNGLMRTMLDAYNQRLTFKGDFAGTAGGAVKYTNQIPLSTDTDGSVFNGTGYKKSSRINSSGVVADLTSGSSPAFVTGFIPVKQGDVIRLKNCWIDPDGTAEVYGQKAGGCNIPCYDTSKTKLGGSTWDNYVEGQTNTIKEVVADENGNTIQFTWDAFNTTAYIRLTLGGDAEKAIVTVNEEIVESGGYDKVSVDADFTNAKGEIVCYVNGHLHADVVIPKNKYHTITYPMIAVRCDGHEENQSALSSERVAGTTTEQSFDVFTVNTKTGTIHITKIGAGADRTVEYKS